MFLVASPNFGEFYQFMATWESGNTGESGTRMEGLGEAASYVEFQERISRVAKVERPVLIVGERGTGKELAVRRLHYLSGRWQGPLVALNCAALSPSVLESELFGHEPGAFTGAQRRRIGRFEAAHGGTLFLDEIGLIPITVQEKILRVVEYGQFERVGGSETVAVDARIIGATNANLPKLAARGRFKRDLLDRLSFEVLYVPPLRARVSDIVLLATHFATRMAMELGWREVPEFSPKAIGALEAYPWPGNIRELKNVVERAVYGSGGQTITMVDFEPFNCPFGDLEDPDDNRADENPPVDRARTDEPDQSAAPAARRRGAPHSATGKGDLKSAIGELERELVSAALERHQHHQGKAASQLGISYDQLRRLIRKHRLIG